MEAPKLVSRSRRAKPRRENVLIGTSRRKGVLGLIETLLRRFRTLSFGVLLSPLIFVCCATVGLAAAPALAWFNFVNDGSKDWPQLLHYAAAGFGVASGYFVFGVCLLFIVPAVNFCLPLRVQEFRGPYYSLPAIPWYVHNALTYMVRYMFLEFVTPSPLNVLFYRMMGMKIGKGVVINSTNISDPALITLGDHVTVGGSATIFAHYGQRGFLVVSRVTIGSGTNIGLKASVMGGCVLGENVMVKPHTALLPKSKIGDGETV